MSQRTRILAEIFGFRGWRITEAFFEWPDGSRARLLPNTPMGSTKFVLRVERRWLPRCSSCGAMCRKVHAQLESRRWRDLPWAEHEVEIEAASIRVACPCCGSCPVEMVAWADPYQRQTRRLQQRLALEGASMPTMHVAVLYGLSWSTVRRAEGHALARWDDTRPPVPLHRVGIDEKWLGRRHKLKYQYLTIVSNLDTGEPVWIGPGREEATVTAWLSTLTVAEKAAIEVVAADMHRPFYNAIQADPDLEHVAFAHDPFHVMKRAGKALSEMRKDTFFRASAELRSIGRGTRWLILRPWERCNVGQRAKLKLLFSYNQQLARAYQIVEELRVVLHAPDRKSMEIGLERILRRTQLRKHEHLRKLHESLLDHLDGILALGEFRPPTGRIEALNNNWETLVRRGRGYRDYQYMLLKLRFMTANPIRTTKGTQRFLALGLHQPLRWVA